MKKREYYSIESALKMNGDNIIPIENLHWVRVVSWNPFENLFATYEEAEQKMRWKETTSPDFYYRIVKLD